MAFFYIFIFIDYRLLIYSKESTFENLILWFIVPKVKRLDPCII